MDEGPRQVLILDSDPDILTTLQHLLEDVGVDATITWDEAEARQLVEGKFFDLILIGDHPPEVDAATILREVRSQGTIYPILILRGIVLETDIEYFRGLGATGVVAKRDPIVVLEQVRKALVPTGSGPHRQPLPWPKPVRSERPPESRHADLIARKTGL